jgi:hypothetical protein
MMGAGATVGSHDITAISTPVGSTQHYGFNQYTSASWGWTIYDKVSYVDNTAATVSLPSRDVIYTFESGGNTYETGFRIYNTATNHTKWAPQIMPR